MSVMEDQRADQTDEPTKTTRSSISFDLLVNRNSTLYLVHLA